MKEPRRLLAWRRVMPYGLLLAAGLILPGLPRDRPVERVEPSASLEEVEDGRLKVAGRSSIPRSRISFPVSTKTAVAPGNVLMWQENEPPRPDSEREFAAFLDWSVKFAQSDSAGRGILESEGIVLARERRAAMTKLIQEDPQRALQLTVPFGIRSQLPNTVGALLEEKISGRGRLDVWIAAASEASENLVEPRVFRYAIMDGREFNAFTYGKRSGLPARENIAMHGIAVDEFFALHENPVRVLEPEEAAGIAAGSSGEEICGVSSLPSDAFGRETIVEVGDEIFNLCQPEHAEELSAKIAGDGDVTLASAWTEGEKKVLFIRVDYSDDTGSPVSGSTLTNTLNSSIPPYRNYSYGRTRLAPFGQGSDWTPLFRLPNTKSSYTSLTTILNHAKNAAQANGYNNDNYDFHVVCSKKTPVSTANALARVNASGVLMNGSFTATLFSHELGHNYGVWHGNFWDSSNPYGLGSGTHLEYGDIFDLMGGDAGGWDLTAQHFNVEFKTRLGWIKNSEFATATSDGGLYRIYAHDNTNSLGKGFLALKVPINSSMNFWMEYRRVLMYPSDNWVINGVGVRWGYNSLSSNGTRLIDTTPGSRSGGSKADRRDSPAVIGRTFSDYPNGIHITPIGLGGTSPPSIDVRVRLGAFPGNRAPVSTLSGRTSAMINETLTFTATASDLDGDELAYYWDFANDQFDSANSPTRNKSWSAAGTYIVRCTVSDMKGGLVTNSLTVSVTTTPAPVSITSHPQSQTNLAGSNVTFNVTATGTAPLTYQWRFNTTNLVSATSSSYTRSNIQHSDAGNYSVVVSNAANSVTSSSATLTVTSPGPNGAPLLAPIENKTVYSGSTLIFTNSAFDPNPGDTLTFSLDPGAPPTASVHPNTGVFSWTPSDPDTNSLHSLTVRVTDNGTPSLSGTASFSVTVLPAPIPNKPPLLGPVNGYIVHAGGTVTFTNLAFDPDGDSLTFSLDPGAPTGAEVNPDSGVFIWTTTDAEANSGNSITIRVTDDGEPPLSGTVTFGVAVEPKPTFENVSKSTNGITLTWSAIPNSSYRIEFKSDLSDLAWGILNSNVTVTGTVGMFSDDEFGGAEQRFYRVMVLSD